MTEKRFVIGNENFEDKIETYELHCIIDDEDNTFYFIADSIENVQLLIRKLNAFQEENEQLRKENKLLKDKYERKDRQLQRTKKDIQKYTDYFMNTLNWDCDMIIQEVFK